LPLDLPGGQFHLYQIDEIQTEGQDKLPNIKSAKKRVKTNKRDEVRNRAAKSAMKSAIKATVESVESGDKDTSQKSMIITQALINRTAKRGIIHKNKAARLTSRLMRKATKAKTA
jgi:small subunit ribosomal protein S20